MVTSIIIGVIGAVAALVGTGGSVLGVKAAKKARKYNEAVAEAYLHLFGTEITMRKHPELVGYAKRAGKRVRKTRKHVETVREAVSDATGTY